MVLKMLVEIVTIAFQLIRASSQGCEYAGRTERSFNAIVFSLFKQGYLPAGDVLDVGAHDGSFSCMYACFDTNRTVHAVDPSPTMIEVIILWK